MDKIAKLEKQLAKTCEEIYLLGLRGKRFHALPPKITVRVLPKEHRTESGLYIPGAVSNKPVYEGIVVEVWRPYDEEHKIKVNGKMEMVTTHRQCCVKVGDRVLFPHWEGQPMSEYLDEKYYRIIPDFCIFGTLDYKGDVKYIKPLKDLMAKFSSVTTSGATPGPGV